MSPINQLPNNQLPGVQLVHGIHNYALVMLLVAGLVNTGGWCAHGQVLRLLCHCGGQLCWRPKCSQWTNGRTYWAVTNHRVQFPSHHSTPTFTIQLKFCHKFSCGGRISMQQPLFNYQRKINCAHLDLRHFNVNPETATGIYVYQGLINQMCYQFDPI